MKKILILGAGLVAKPMVEYLLKYDHYFVTLADKEQDRAKSIIGNASNAKDIALDVHDKNSVSELVKEADIVISLLPYTLHVSIAEVCLEHKKPLVTASYVSPAMKALDQQAKDQGVILLNEIGLDPGIDHMSAMKIINEVAEKGGKVISFESICGGLPAPDANNNPFGYKFSWSPRGVVMAGRNNAHYLKDGKEIIIDGKDLFKNHWRKNVESLGELEVYPNRNSMLYEELYGLKDAHTIFRGTFRNPGWCDTLLRIAQLGFLNDEEKPELTGKTFAEVMAHIINADSVSDIKAKTASHLGIDTDSEVIGRLEWLGLFSDEGIKTDPVTLLDILANRMLIKMLYKNGEKDMIILQHDFIAEYPDKKEHIISLLIDYGIPGGATSMARTVSLPAAIAVKLILEDKIKLTGVHIPNLPEIYKPVLEELEEMNIKFEETVRQI